MYVVPNLPSPLFANLRRIEVEPEAATAYPRRTAAYGAFAARSPPPPPRLRPRPGPNNASTTTAF